MARSKVKFVAREVVMVHVRGKSRGAGFTRDDDGLVGRLLSWIVDSETYPDPEVRAGSSGGGSYVGFFSKADAKKVARWLKAEGAKEVEYHGS